MINDVIIALAHNGTLVNTSRLRACLVDEGVQAHAVTSAAFLAAVRGNLEASL